MNPSYPRGSESDISNQRPRRKIERKQPTSQSNIGAALEQDTEFRSRKASNLSNSNLKPLPGEEKQYRKVVRKQPKPDTLDSEASAQIDAREKILAGRAARARPDQRNDDIEIDFRNDNEPERNNVQPNNFAKRLSSAIMKSKPVPPVVPNQRKNPKPKKRSSLKDQDMYDLPDVSRTSSEIENMNWDDEEDEDDDDEKYNTRKSCSYNPIYLIALAAFIIVVVVISTTIGIVVSSKPGKLFFIKSNVLHAIWNN